jgi:hypothetical protein
MKKLLPLSIAVNGLLFILSLVILFHILVITNLIPFDIVWGGRLADKGQMLRLEAISIAVNLVMLLIVCVYAGVLKIKFNPTLLKICFWIMFALFALNTLGNITSKNSFEAFVFTPLTILLALFCLRIALAENK